MRGRALLPAVLSLLLVLAPAAMAGVTVPIEGWLTLQSPLGYYVMSGTSDNLSPGLPGSELSPRGDRVLVSISNTGVGPQGGGTTDLWAMDVDGNNAVDLSATAGLTGINCMPKWSPDASLVAFQHCDAVLGEFPCNIGWDVWVMRADGTDAHRVTPEGYPHTDAPEWAPNGYYLLCRRELGTLTSISVDADGSDLRELPFVTDWDVRFSRDGAKLLYTRTACHDDESWWKQLVLCNADGTDARSLYERSLSHNDIDTYLANGGYTAPSPDPCGAVANNLGPAVPAWSPAGDRIAFVMELPFDSSSPRCVNGRQLWMCDYDAVTGTVGEPIQVTDMGSICGVAWVGNNTSPEHPSATVDNTTVTFDEVTGEGLTTIIRDDDPPPLPTGFGFASEYYQITTTAEVAGPITVSFTYRDQDIPSGAESTLCIYHWDEESQTWADITVSRDTESNIVYGVTDSLSLFGLAIEIPEGHFSDVPATGYGESGYFPYWAFWQIEACVAAGIVTGYSDGTYRPAVEVKRDQMAVYISRALVGGDANVPTGPAQPTFSDVLADHWAYKYIEYCVANYIVVGYAVDNTYRPGEKVNRGQMAAYVARAIYSPRGIPPDDLPGYTPPADPRFPDVPTDHAFYKYVEYIAGAGVVQGYGDGTYRPAEVVNRGQMAVYVARAFGLPA